ncbi:STAS domain-containing protein [Arcobacter sp.]|uniref:STAS domain-containing protein n=1 Tax=Arcobacter sp. TaxID=1872629 RepID=UPI003D0FC304
MISLEENQLRLTLQNEFNIYSVEELKKSLEESFDVVQNFIVSLEEVQSFDSSAFSLLVSLKKEAVDAGKTITFINISTEVQDYIETMNVLELFEGEVDNE